MIQVFAFLIIPMVNGLSFNFTSFAVGVQEIKYEGNASLANEAIQLTENLIDRVGRATYYKPLHLWDEASGNLTDFSTHFSFVIDSNGSGNYGDGFAFFLAPNGSIDHPLESGGNNLGLGNVTQNTATNHFVAVEFDTYNNTYSAPYDPPCEHVGIDINSLQSVIYSSWLSGASFGKENEAWISYNATTHILSVGFTDSGNVKSISNMIDLRSCLPEWVSFGFSGSTGSSTATHIISSWDFSSTLKDNVTVPFVDSPPSKGPSTNSNRKNRTLLGAGLAAGGAGGVVLVCLIVILCKKMNQKDEYDALENGLGQRKFSYCELIRATNNFNEKLGEGGFGGVYKGFLRDMNAYVAVKKISSESKQGIKEYGAEVKIISRLRHRNLVQLIGWCREGKRLLLVYEFLPNGSLESHLFNKERLLAWEARYRIAKDLASGLLYLHEEGEQCVLYRDIKPSNILLDTNFSAKLGDFGLARLVDHVKGSRTTVLAGTIGYMAPECSRTGKTSKESDVYSFGVVALEIACGRKPIDPMAVESNQVDMVSWVWELYGSGNLLDAADPRLCGDFDEEQMERLLMVGLWCAHPNDSVRPSIRQSTRVLNFEAPMPVLPAKMLDQPTYFPTPTNAS